MNLCDLSNFTFLVSRPDLCISRPELLVMVHTAVHHRTARNILRTYWDGGGGVTVFLLGVSTEEEEMDQVMEEAEEEGDMVIGNFVDSYRNLTYKHMMGHLWVRFSISSFYFDHPLC